MVEWWAYLADVLTFYNERSANEAYLRTASQAESLDHLIRLLGYRPSPGIGAVGHVAVLLSGPGPVTIPAGFQVQSKPGPGKKPQIFEVDSPTQVDLPDVVSAVPKLDGLLLSKTADERWSVLLAGTVTSVRPGDSVLLQPKPWSPLPDPAPTVWVSVIDVAVERDPAGSPNTRLVFSKELKDEPSLPALEAVAASQYRVLRSTLSAGLWPYEVDSEHVWFVIGNGPFLGPSDPLHLTAHLSMDSVQRQITAGDTVVVEVPGRRPPTPAVMVVDSYSEKIWFANGDPNNPGKPESNLLPGVSPIPIPITWLDFTNPPDLQPFQAQTSAVRVRFGWQEVAQPIPTTLPSVALDGSVLALVPAGARFSDAEPGTPCLVEDAKGAGVLAQLIGQTISLTGITGPALTLPLRGLFDLLPVSRGSTVPREVLGSGDATQVCQEFTLKKSPVTYLSQADPGSGPRYASTVTVWVDGLRWKEVPSFYGQPPDARVFVTRGNPDASTRILFGEGINGARLPSGVDNVVASYRIGSGMETPDPGSLTVVVKPQPKVKALRNPVAVAGGADPDPPEQIRRYAPRSVLTFDRAVSADDYEAIAATAPGVVRARAYWGYDGTTGRASVLVYADDPSPGMVSTKNALATADDPNRPVVVLPAKVRQMTLALTVVPEPDRAPEQVIAAVRAAMIDPLTGLFGVGRLRIGDSVFASTIYAACLSVPGVIAVRSLLFLAIGEDLSGPRFDPGQGGVFQLDSAGLKVNEALP
jgi:hypothetical protein